jgi:hypothetical protein
MVFRASFWRGARHLSKGILKAPKFLKFELVNQKQQICSRLTSADRGGQKNRNGQMIAIFYNNVFYYISEEATCALSFIQIHKLCTTVTLSSWEKNPHLDWGSYVKDIGF